MTPEARRVAIAEACGFVDIMERDCSHEDYPFWDLTGRSAISEPWRQIPDYLNSLDAMHEAEKVLTEKQRDGSDGYMEWLDWVVVRDGSKGRSWHTAHATAAQRAEAFLRTIGKWDDSK